jgi:hypothetical protein
VTTLTPPGNTTGPPSPPVRRTPSGPVSPLVPPDAGAAIAAMPAIPLGELQVRADLLTRVDRKYVVPIAWLGELVAGLESGAQVLEIDGRRGFGYRSVYFDTGELASFLGAARRRRRRFKVRTRTYLDAATCWLEVKTRGPRGATVKHRLPYYREYEESVSPARWFVDQVLDAAGVSRAEHLAFDVVIASHYRRSTFLLPASASRVTVDTELEWVDAAGRRLTMPGFAIVETKTGSTPSSVDRLLWSQGHRPARISKYATALAALNPQLPATPWHRTIDRCFSVRRA